MNTQVEVKSPKDTVLALRERATKSPVFSALAHTFAMRERTRQQIVLTTLFNTMVKEGFNFKKSEYAKELEFLAFLGIGKIDRDGKERTRALKGIKVTLQSVGMAAISKQDTLAKAHFSATFAKLPVIDFHEKLKSTIDAVVSVTIVIEILGQKLEVPCPPDKLTKVLNLVKGE